jgi:DivIVA protein
VSLPDQYQRPPLRYRRFGGGYRREDVEFALAELRLTLRQLDKDLEALRDRNRVLETELQTARAEVERLRTQEHEPSHSMAGALRRAGEIEEVANAHARDIIAQAEEAALRIRAEASQRMQDSSEQFNELLRLKSSLLEAMRGVVIDFDQAISRVERGEDLFPNALPAAPLGAPAPAVPGQASAAEPAAPPSTEDAQPWAAPEAAQPWTAPAEESSPPAASPEVPPAVPEAPPVPVYVPPAEEPPAAVAPPPPPPAPAPPAPAPDTASIPASPPPAPPPVAELTAAAVPAAEAPPGEAPAAAEAVSAAQPEPEPDEQLFETRVELDAGPFTDFAALSAFERTLAHLEKVEDVYVRRLADDRALIELTLGEPSRLLEAMRHTLPYSIDVRSADGAKIVMDVSVQAPAAIPGRAGNG